MGSALTPGQIGNPIRGEEYRIFLRGIPSNPCIDEYGGRVLAFNIDDITCVILGESLEKVGYSSLKVFSLVPVIKRLSEGGTPVTIIGDLHAPNRLYVNCGETRQYLRMSKLF